MRSIQQHGSAGVDREAEDRQSRLTNELARHQGGQLWCCGHNLPLEGGEKIRHSFIRPTEGKVALWRQQGQNNTQSGHNCGEKSRVINKKQIKHSVEVK